MPSGNQTAAIVVGLVIAGAAVGGGLYFVLQKHDTTPAGHSDTSTPAKPAEPPAADTTTPSFPVVAFDPAVSQFVVAKPTPAYVEPNVDAPQMYTVQPGTPISTTQTSKDKKWVVSVTEDGRAAYLLLADLGPFDSSSVVTSPTQPDNVTGTAEIDVDTATLQINGQQVHLFGITGETGVLADQFQEALTGVALTCTLQDQSYVCMMPNGTDVARFALFNGVAQPAADATDDYRAVADSAKAGHKGVWK